MSLQYMLKSEASTLSPTHHDTVTSRSSVCVHIYVCFWSTMKGFQLELKDLYWRSSSLCWVLKIRATAANSPGLPDSQICCFVLVKIRRPRVKDSKLFRGQSRPCRWVKQPGWWLSELLVPLICSFRHLFSWRLAKVVPLPNFSEEVKR
jgi:hypothetical protein